MANQIIPQFDLGGLSQLMLYADDVKAIIAATKSNEELGDKIKAAAPSIIHILTGVASTLYPGLAPALQIAAGALATFDQNGVKWLQGALNKFLVPSPNLVVDGVIGPATINAVRQAQQQLGITPDGFAGKVTFEALKKALELQA